MGSQKEGSPREPTYSSRSVAALSSLSFAQFAIAVVGAALLAMAIFRHADRHGSRHATAWGLFTFLFALAAIPLYLLCYWAAKRRDR